MKHIKTIGIIIAIIVAILLLYKYNTPTSQNNLSVVDENNIHMCLMGGGKNCDVILDPAHKDIYGPSIQKICAMMPMDICMTYFSGNTNNTIDNLPPAKTSAIIRLNSGDSYTMEITEVKLPLGGKWVKMLAYNGSIPGPTLQAPQGATITLKLVNKVPDLITTLHSHGVRLSDLFDGVPKSMMGAQDPMKFGDSFEYSIHFPDKGLFRYHPHMDEQIQQELGLYGNYLITSGETITGYPISSEHVIVLDDIQLSDDGSPQVEKNPNNQMLMGRYGNKTLVNGQDRYTQAITGNITRLYLTNTANVRPFNLTITGATMKVIGSDLGMYEKASIVDTIIIAPAERYIVDVYFPHTGSYTLVNTTPQGSTPLATLDVSFSESGNNLSTFMNTQENQEAKKEIDRFRPYFDKAIDKSITLDMTMQMNHGNMNGNMMGMMHSKEQGSPITMPGLRYDSNTIEREDNMKMMNDMSSKDNTKRKIIDNQTQKENMDIDRSFTQGDIIKVHITNKSNSMHPMQHPIHFHGQRFLVINHNGSRNTNLVRKDTVLLGAGDTADILIDMSNPGSRMAHCHIAEHLMDGMMMHFDVKESPNSGTIMTMH